MNFQYPKLIYDFKFETLHKIMSFITPNFLAERWLPPPPFACLTHNVYETWLYSPVPFATTTIQSRHLILMPSHCGHNKVVIDLYHPYQSTYFGVGQLSPPNKSDMWLGVSSKINTKKTYVQKRLSHVLKIR